MKKIRLLLIYTLALFFISNCKEDTPIDLTEATNYKSWEEFSECSPEEPDLDCIKKIFIPLSEGNFPFDREIVGSAFQRNETYIAPNWQLTAIHVLEANIQLGNISGCFFKEDQFANPDIISCPGVGSMLFIGGHPQTEICKNSNTSMAVCVDQVPLNESFDFAIVKAPVSEIYLQIASKNPAIGEQVFLVSNPGFSWLTIVEQEQLATTYPLVSTGKVIEVQGRSIITNTLAYAGSSGGVLINSNGEVLGVASTLIGHIRNQGVDIFESLSDYYTVFVGFTEKARSVVNNNLTE